MGIEKVTLGKSSTAAVRGRSSRDTVPPPAASIRSAFKRVRQQAADARRIASAIERLERLAEYAERNAADAAASGVRVIDLGDRQRS